jgi:hypothetical protein
MNENKKQIITYTPKDAILAMLDGSVLKNKEGKNCFYNDDLHCFEQREPDGKRRCWNLVVFDGLYRVVDD